MHIYLKTQQAWSTFSIGAVMTFIGVAVSVDVPEISLLPIILLLLISLKMRNYRESIMNIAAYMIARDESPKGFYWKTSLNRNQKEERRAQSGIARIAVFLETQELTLMAILCTVLYAVEYIDS